MTEEQFVRITKWTMGALAVIASYLLVQSEVVVPGAVKVGLGALLAFAAYVNPASLVPSKFKS